MTTSNKKIDCDDHIDRISDLPGEVIGNILAHLPIVDVVRTSILSRKWRYMWISVPKLEFGYDFFTNCQHLEGPTISNIITDVLSLHDGSVYKFTFKFWHKDDWVTNERLNKWIFILSRNGIKDLEVLNQHSDLLQIPSHIFSCQGLIHLKLEGFKLSSVSPNFCGFRSLRVLKLCNMRFDSVALKSVISGCPLLEELTILFCHDFEYIDVAAPTLKVLHIDNSGVNSGVIKLICLEKVRNLTDLTLIGNVNYERGRVFDLVKGMLTIERLIMGTGYIKMLSENSTQPMLRRSFDSLKYLKLNVVNFEESRQLWFVVNLLKSASNLVELVIKGLGGPLVNPVWKLEHDGCCLRQLKIVNITYGFIRSATSRFETDAMNLIVRFILSKSPLLETLTFRVIILDQWKTEQTDLPTVLSISRDLLQMDRASPRAQIRFLYRDII